MMGLEIENKPGEKRENVAGRSLQQKAYDGDLLFKRVHTARRDKDALLSCRKDDR
jgi:hypothetical protein